jgi:hypothetical protein
VFHQLGVSALLDDPASVEDHDPAQVSDGGEPMRDRDHRTAGHHLAERVVDGGLRLRVERGRGLVEDQDGRVPVERASQRDPLPLATGQGARRARPHVPSVRYGHPRRAATNLSADARRNAASICTSSAPPGPAMFSRIERCSSVPS